jgi:Na+/melibiose symporter-like transporter
VNIIRWFNNPNIPPSVNKKNFLNVQADAIGVGLANAASPFLPVFLTRLGATNLQVSLLTSMPALTGLILSIPAGRFLQRRRKIVPWFSAARLVVILSYALTGVVSFLVPQDKAIIAILAIWALATLPQTVVAICFSVVMNAVAGPANRYELMTRRWSILGFTSSVTVILVGQILVRLDFPINYQLVFMGLSLGGLVSYFFSSHINLPETEPAPSPQGQPWIKSVSDYAHLVFSEKPFISFIWKRFIFLTGTALSAPIFPLYLVREVDASDAWIGVISTAQSAILILGYFLWSRQSKLHGSRRVVLWTTLGVSLYPFLVALTHQV